LGVVATVTALLIGQYQAQKALRRSWSKKTSTPVNLLWLQTGENIQKLEPKTKATGAS